MKEFPPMPKVYGTVTIGERGQVVIPAKLRKEYGLGAGEKLIVIGKNGGPIGLIPAQQFNAFISQHEQFLAQVRKTL